MDFADERIRAGVRGGISIVTNHAEWCEDPTALPLARPAKVTVRAKHLESGRDTVPAAILDEIEPLFAGQSHTGNLYLDNEGLVFSGRTIRFSMTGVRSWIGTLSRLGEVLRGSFAV